MNKYEVNLRRLSILKSCILSNYEKLWCKSLGCPTSISEVRRDWSAHTGWTRSTTARNDRFIISSTLRNRMVTAICLRNHLQEVRNVNVSGQLEGDFMLLDYLFELGLLDSSFPWIPDCKVELCTRTLGLDNGGLELLIVFWCIAILYYGLRQTFKSVEATRQEICSSIVKIPFGGGSVMPWEGISFEACTELVIIKNGDFDCV